MRAVLGWGGSFPPQSPPMVRQVVKRRTHVFSLGDLSNSACRAALLLLDPPSIYNVLHVHSMRCIVAEVGLEDVTEAFSQLHLTSFISLSLPAGGVLVHCLAGVSRSATVVIGYLMWKNMLPFHQARRHVAAVRPWIRPNAGFQQQLLAFQDAGCKLPGQGPAATAVGQNDGCHLPRKEASSCSVLEGYA